jgi:hypothetical protein
MRIVSGPLYRARQVGWALRPGVGDAERTEAREVLDERLFALFEAMDAADQRHCIDVYRAARSAGCEDQEVLTAALIHDCGKAASAEDGRVRLWHRVAYVVLGTVAPRVLRRLARRPGGLRLLERHAERGLELAAANGASQGVLALVQGMEDGETSDERVLLLREADDLA